MFTQQYRRTARIIIAAIVLSTAGLSGGFARAEIIIDYDTIAEAGSARELSEYLETLHQNSLDNGVRNFTPMALSLIHKSRKFLATGDTEQARVCAQYARIFAPDFPPAIVNEGYVSWSLNKLMVHRLLSGVVWSYVKQFQTLDQFSFDAFGQLAAFGGALLLALAGISALSLARNYRLFYHDLGHALTENMPGQTVRVAAVLLIVLPLLLGFSIFWMFAYWLMLFWSYNSRKEQLVLGSLVGAFVFIVPLIAAACAFFLYMPQSDLIQSLWQANYGYCDRQGIEKLEQFADQYPDDEELLLTIGLVNKREQNYVTALSYYGRLLAKNPQNCKACVNAGNVYLAIGEWEKAVEKYKTAIAASERSAAAHFNYARAFQQKFMFKEGEQQLTEAKQLDGALIDRFLNIYSENYNRLIIDETVPKWDLWKKGLGMFLAKPQLINSVWNMLLKGLPLPFGTLAVLVLLVINMATAGNERLRVAMKCTLCGKTMCRRCQRSVAAEILCYQCLNFLKKQERLSFKQKEEKKSQIAHYVRGIREVGAIFSRICPGTGHVWKGQVLRGTVWTLIFFWLLCKFLFALLAEGPWAYVISDAWLFATIYGALALFVWYLLLMSVRGVRSKEIDDNVVLKSVNVDI